jgi:hypothetical protein
MLHEKIIRSFFVSMPGHADAGTGTVYCTQAIDHNKMDQP